MKITGYVKNHGTPTETHDLRDLSVEELKHHAVFKPVVAEARSRFALFRVLDDNFHEWTDYLKSLLHPGAVDDDAVALKLDRLLLNYLNAAHHLRQHFEASFQQRLRADDAEHKRYKMLVEQLTQTSWPFAFIQDFRFHLQRQGLGLGFFRRTVGPTSVTLEITLNAAEILNLTKDWPRSKLAATKGIMPLVPLLRDFHAQMMQGYAGIVVRTLFAELLPAEEFYKKLAAEVRQKDPRLSLAFRDDGASLSGSNAEPKLIFVPNDLLAELGVPTMVRK